MATACPGEVIGSLSTHLPGPGTHIYESNIHASISGLINTRPATSKSSKPTISISRNSSPTAPSSTLTSLPTSTTKLPQVGSTILGRILRVQQRQLTVSILLVDPPSNITSTTNNNSNNITLYTNIISDELQPQAILRREDVRSYEKDKVVMNDMYRTGDIIRATVISLGDEKNYYISTAGNDFGVVIAKSEEGNALVPVTWKEMKDIATGKAELRKVAKPA